MRKTIITTKLKFVSNTCDSLRDKIYDDLNRGMSSFPSHMANEYIEVLRELKTQADVWTDREIEGLTMHEYESVVRFIFDRFNKLMSILFPGEMTVI